MKLSLLLLGLLFISYAVAQEGEDEIEEEMKEAGDEKKEAGDDMKDSVREAIEEVFEDMDDDMDRCDKLMDLCDDDDALDDLKAELTKLNPEKPLWADKVDEICGAVEGKEDCSDVVGIAPGLKELLNPSSTQPPQ